MRKISIKTETGNLDIFDDSDVPMDKYCNELSKIMKMNNIVTLQTTESSVIVRPSKIIGIQVKELFLEDDLKDIEYHKKEEESLVVDEPETPEPEENTTEEIEEKIQPENTPPNPEENQEQKDKTEDIITDVD